MWIIVILFGVVIAFVYWFSSADHTTTGLFKANLRAYFMALEKGLSKKEARMFMLRSRYGDDIDKINTLSQAFMRSFRFEEPDTEAKALVLEICLFEKGHPDYALYHNRHSVQDISESDIQDYASEIEEIYSELNDA